MAIIINSLDPTFPVTTAGNSITFVVDAEDTTGAVLSYQWQFSTDGNIYTSGGLVNNTSSTYQTSNLTINQNGLYFRVAISDGVSTIYSDEYPGIGPRIVSVIQDPTIITEINQEIDFYPTSETVDVGETLSFTISASLINADVTTPTLVTNLGIQWQYSSDNGNNWINITSGGNTSISSTVAALSSTPTTYYKFSTLQISNITFDYNLYLYRAVVSYTGATNTPVTLPSITLLVSPQINVYRQPGEGNDTQEFFCYKTSDTTTGKIKLQVGALSTAATTLSYAWEFSTNGTEFLPLSTILTQYNCILKPGTVGTTDVLELERFIFYNALYARCIISGISGEASVTTNNHIIYPKDSQVAPTLPTTVYNIIEDRYGDVPERQIYVNDPVKNAIIESALNTARNTGLNGNISLIYQRKNPGSTVWSDIGDSISIPTDSNFISYTLTPSSTAEVTEIQYVTPPLRRDVDNGAKYRLKINSTSLFTRNGSVKTLVPYYSSEITLNVYRTVYILAQPQNTSSFPNTTTSFSLSATVSSGSVNDITYQWQYNTSASNTGWLSVPNSSPYTGVNTNTLLINPTPASLTRRFFRCVVSVPNQLASVTTRIAEVTLQRDFFTEITSINDAFVNEFENVTFSVTASSLSQGTITYQWQKSTDYNPITNLGNWADIPGKTTNTLNLIGVSPSDNAYYRLKLVSFGGEIAYSNAARLSVTPLAVSVTQDIPSSITVLEGVPNAYLFSCEGFSSLANEVSYQWQRSLPYTEISGTTYTITTQSYTLNGTNYPVRGFLYVPTIPNNNIDVVVLYHGTITSQSETIMQAAQRLLGFALSDTVLNIRDKIVFSVAYPQDSIPAANQFGIGGNEDPNFLFDSNLPFARASLLWAKNSINAYLTSIGVSKTRNRIYTLGHSQGGSLVHKLNTLEQVDGAIMNAPGPIKLDLTCAAQEASGNLSTTCRKLFDLYGSATGVNRSQYLSRSVISYNTGLLSEMLYIQGQQDTAGGGQQTSWLEDLLDLISANSGTNEDYTYLPVPGGHEAIVTSFEAQEAIRDFVNSSATSPTFENIGAGFGGTGDTSKTYAPLAFDKITQNLSRIRCKLTAEGIPNPAYTTQCVINVNRKFSYFADTAIKLVTAGSSLNLDLNPSSTGGTPEYSWEYSTDNGSSWIIMNEIAPELFIPVVDASYLGRIYRCKITLAGCNQHEYTRNNVTSIVSVNEVAYTLPIRLNVVNAASKPTYYSLQTQKTGASIGTVIAVPKPAGYVNDAAATTDDFTRWNVSRSGGLTTSAATSVESSGPAYTVNKPSWASSNYKSPRWNLQNDRFKGYIEMRGQYLKANEFPELARMFGTTYGGTITNNYPRYGDSDVFRMPNLYGKRLMGTGNVDNNRGSVSITPLYGPNGLSGGDKNIPGSMGGLFNYTRSAQLPPGSPGVSGIPDGTAGLTTPTTYTLGSFRSEGFTDVNSFVQPTIAGTLRYITPADVFVTVDTPLHSHSAVSAGWREVNDASTSGCRGKAQELVGNRFRGTQPGSGELLDLSDIIETGNSHNHGCQSGCGETIDMVRDGGINISDSTVRLAGSSRQLFDNSLRFYLRNNTDIPLNSPYFRLKYMIKAY